VEFEYMNAKMVSVVDGDTMDFLVDLGFHTTKKIRVRLKGIDTPEIFHPRNSLERVHGKAAKEFVIKNFLGKTGTLTTFRDKKGKFGRYLATFSSGGDDLVGLLKANGFEKRSHYG
jgi:micrococcal nuclease